MYFLIKNLVPIPWLQPEHPFINKKYTSLTKNLISTPWIQPERPFVNKKCTYLTKNLVQIRCINLNL